MAAEAETIDTQVDDGDRRHPTADGDRWGDLAGLITTDSWWRGELAEQSGVYISDDASDWIEELANGEDPETP